MAEWKIAAGFEPVADAFRANFDDRAETGAALAVVVNGETVVNLWAGGRDREGRPWTHDTCVPLFSTGKGAAAVTVLRLASLGLLDLDRPVASFWRGFGANGKGMVTPRQILEHRSGLWRFGQLVDARDLDDPDRMSSIIEGMAPQHEPGMATAYHVATFGSLLTQIVMRVDPAGRSLSRYFADEIARPRSLAIAFGRNPAGTSCRAGLVPPGVTQWVDLLVRAPSGLRWALFNPLSNLHEAMREVRLPVLRQQDWLAHDLPSGNAVGTARSVAEFYAELAVGGGRLGLSTDLAEELSSRPPSDDGEPDLVMGIRNRFQLGFARPTPDFPFWDRPEAFGMSGLGGSFAFADPVRRLGYAYLPNRLGFMPFDDGREARLRKTLAQCLIARADAGAVPASD